MERRLGTELDGLRRQAANEGRFAETIGVAVSAWGSEGWIAGRRGKTPGRTLGACGLC